ncbi:MAG: Integral membrane protein [Rhodobacteraceae bacterium HLUCCO07]|nr:MAG: Integral membrane protein [Rhodobacteraceae bacterium HLUCCO07]
MPHRWTHGPDGEHEVVLWPHRSLPRRGFAAIILMAFLLATVPLYGVLGTMVLWGLLPFMLLVVGGLWWALEHTYKTAEMRETLTITPELTRLVHQPVKGEILTWECNTYWTRAHSHASGGPVAHYITLTGNGREVEIGRFLTEKERKSLIGEINEALTAAGERG